MGEDDSVSLNEILPMLSERGVLEWELALNKALVKKRTEQLAQLLNHPSTERTLSAVPDVPEEPSPG